MPKTLYDMSIAVVARHLNRLSNVAQMTTAHDKRHIMACLVGHEDIYLRVWPSISYNLVSSQITELELSHSRVVDDSLLICFAGVGCKLTTVTLIDLDCVTDFGIGKLCSSQTESLRKLHLKRMNRITCESLSDIRLRNMVKLSLQFCVHMKTLSLHNFIKNNVQLKELDLSGNNKLDDPGYIIEALAYLRLESLNLSGIHNGDDACVIKLSIYCQRLKKLNLNGWNKVSHEMLSRIINIMDTPNHLSLKYCSSFISDPSVCTKLGQSLVDLDISGVQINNSELLVNVMKQMKNLRLLSLSGIPRVDNRVLEEILRYVGQDLVTLKLDVNFILTDRGILNIPLFCNSLENIYLNSVSRIRGTSLKHLFEVADKAKKLKIIHIGNIKKFDQDIIYLMLKQCINLEEIVLCNIECVDDTIVAAIGQFCPLLVSLDIKACTKVTDAGIHILSQKCPLLQMLNVSGINNLTDASIFSLANHNHDLHYLYMNGCECISKSALNYLVDCCNGNLFWNNHAPNRCGFHLMAKDLDNGIFCRTHNFNYDTV